MPFILALLYIDGSEIPPQLDVVNIPLLTMVENTCQVGVHRISSIHINSMSSKNPPKKSSASRPRWLVGPPSVWSLGLLNQSWRRSRSSLLAFCQHHQHPQSYVSPLSRVIPLPNGLNDSYMGLTNHLLTGMILQVLAFCQNH